MGCPSVQGLIKTDWIHPKEGENTYYMTLTFKDFITSLQTLLNLIQEQRRSCLIRRYELELLASTQVPYFVSRLTKVLGSLYHTDPCTCLFRGTGTRRKDSESPE